MAAWAGSTRPREGVGHGHGGATAVAALDGYGGWGWERIGGLVEQSRQVGGEGAEASESWRPYPPPSVAGEAVGWERVQAPGRRSSERRGSTAGVGGGLGRL